MNPPNASNRIEEKTINPVLWLKDVNNHTFRKRQNQAKIRRMTPPDNTILRAHIMNAWTVVSTKKVREL